MQRLAVWACDGLPNVAQREMRVGQDIVERLHKTERNPAIVGASLDIALRKRGQEFGNQFVQRVAVLHALMVGREALVDGEFRPIRNTAKGSQNVGTMLM